jgi:hypothetical protein
MFTNPASRGRNGSRAAFVAFGPRNAADFCSEDRLIQKLIRDGLVRRFEPVTAAARNSTSPSPL